MHASHAMPCGDFGLSVTKNRVPSASQYRVGRVLLPLDIPCRARYFAIVKAEDAASLKSLTSQRMDSYLANDPNKGSFLPGKKFDKKHMRWANIDLAVSCCHCNSLARGPPPLTVFSTFIARQRYILK